MRIHDREHGILADAADDILVRGILARAFAGGRGIRVEPTAVEPRVHLFLLRPSVAVGHVAQS